MTSCPGNTCRPATDLLWTALWVGLWTAGCLALSPAARAADVLVGPQTPTVYLANSTDPGIGMAWVEESFDEGAWSAGAFGIGYDTANGGARDLIQTTVPTGAVSIYTRTRFQLPTTPVLSIYLGVDYDDGVIAWINGVEVYRSPQMPTGPIDWQTRAIDHESSNDSVPLFVPIVDISGPSANALHAGENVLAIGVWNAQPTSSDLVLVPRLSINESLELMRGPYLQNATQATVNVRWRTNLPSISRVSYGAAPDDLDREQSAFQPTTEHVVRLTNLEPATRYFYAVGDDSLVLAGGEPTHTFVTPPVRGSAVPTRIWVLGDSGTGNNGARAVRDAYYAESQGRPTDLWLMLGDNAYPDGTDGNFQSKLFDIYGSMLRRSVLWPTLGNHDLVRADNATQSGTYFDIFTLPTGPHPGGAASGTEAYYSFDHANIHFVVLDSNASDRRPEGAMLTWLAADLAANTQDWLIALWHHSPYSRGSHDSDVEIELIEMREYAVPLLEDHGVDLVLTAHSHSYERSYLIDGHIGASDTFDDSMKVDGGDGDVRRGGAYAKPDLGPAPHSGAVYTVAGSSGKISGGPLDHPVMVRSLNALGSVILDVDGGRLEARFLDDQGSVEDAYTLIKGCADPNQRYTSRGSTPGSTSEVYTPGLCDGGAPCSSETGTSISHDFAGAFWSVGHGDPEVGPGVDNGGFAAFDPVGGGWVAAEPGSPATLDGTWAIDGGIDGCMADGAAPRCMAVLLSDQHQGVGYFSIQTDQEDADGNFSFARPGGEPIALTALPRPRIQGSAVVSPTEVEVQVAPAPLPGGVLLDAGCNADMIVGYRLYEQRTGRQGSLPLDRTHGGGATQTGWTPAAGGSGPNGEPLPQGSLATVTLTCFTAADIALGASLVFSSGFETPVVSADSSRILCSNCEFDQDLDGSCGLFLDGIPGVDCDDQSATVYPGAEQLCGDFRNNDCRHPQWPGLVGTNERDDDGDGFSECAGDCRDDIVEVWSVPGSTDNLRFSQDGQSLAWNPPSNLGGDLVAYDTLRTTNAADFDAAASCIDADQGLPFAIDPETPPSQTAFYYLIRVENACGGTMGSDSSGTRRAARSCP